MISDEDYKAIYDIIWNVSRKTIADVYKRHEIDERLSRTHVFFGITDTRNGILDELEKMRRGERCSWN